VIADPARDVGGRHRCARANGAKSLSPGWTVCLRRH
jgi:hypothetical protein